METFVSQNKQKHCNEYIWGMFVQFRMKYIFVSCYTKCEIRKDGVIFKIKRKTYVIKRNLKEGL